MRRGDDRGVGGREAPMVISPRMVVRLVRGGHAIGVVWARFDLERFRKRRDRETELEWANRR